MAEDLVNGTQADVRCIHFVKDADETGHDNNPEQKVRALEEFDSYFLGAFKRLVPSESVIVICSDHATPCELGIHSADPVPVLVAGLETDSLTTFGESSARRGDLHISAGCELMRSVTSHYKTRLCELKL
jgi:2,3-bisphosphoglycerate-independent phosphoglycerate mutase